MVDDNENDLGVADETTTSTKEPKSSRAWLAAIADAEKVFGRYHDKADNIDRLFANLEKLASVGRDRQFQLFWANIQVLAPSVYSRPPVPVVVPRFQDRRPLRRTTAELLERSTTVGFERQDVDGVMRLLRDDLSVLSRGCGWVRYEKKSKDDPQRVCIEWVYRRDYLHAPARAWQEVSWVAKRSWLTRKGMRTRFKKRSGDGYKAATYAARKEDEGHDDNRQKAGVWEIWHKDLNKVVWVTEGCEVVLDEDKPHLNLEGFFPCPRPVYGTLERGSLIPVPDFVFYKDQLEEINELTARIGALTDAVRIRGFYPGGAGEIADAIETAMKMRSDNAALIPISNWAGLGGGGAKDMVVWWPIDMIVAAIKEMVALRTQLVNDVYQITGLSDIMRGDTQASETLGAQQLKSQYGSVRIRDKQDEMVRFARDITRISAEIMSEEFDKDTLLSMSQMEIETDADVAKTKKGLTTQRDQILKDIEKSAKDPEVKALAEQNPDQAQQVLQQAHDAVASLNQQIEALDETVTIEKCVKLLRDEKTRPFVLDIETDSTIAPDENATKQRATEYITAIGGLIAQALPELQTTPQAAPVVAAMLKYANSQFRVGRDVQQAVDKFADEMDALASQPKPPPGPNPDEIRAQAEAQATQTDAQTRQLEAQAKTQEVQTQAQVSQMEVQERQQALGAKAQIHEHDLATKQGENAVKLAQVQADSARASQLHDQSLQEGQLRLQKLMLEIEHLKTKNQGAALDVAGKALQPVAVDPVLAGGVM